MFATKGRVLGPSTESAEQAVKFSTGRRFFLISALGCLPDYAPWTKYGLVLRPREGSPLHDVMEVTSARARVLKKAELEEYKVRKRRGDANYASWLKRTMRKYPQVLTRIEDLEGAPEDVARDSWPAFESETFFSLLRDGFPSAFLRKLDDEQRAGLLRLCEEKPHLLCFWEKGARSLLEARRPSGLPLFDGADQDLLKISHKYACSHGERLCSTDDPLWFAARCPQWGLRKLVLAAKRLGRELPCPLPVLKEALEFYVLSRKLFYARGRFATFFPKDASPEASEFLVEQGIMVRSPRLNALLRDPEMARMERAVADFVTRRVRRLVVVDCPYYNDEYARRFLELGLGNARSVAFFGGNLGSVLHMRLATGLPFQTIGKVVGASTVVVDRAHKIGPEQFLRLARRLRSKRVDLHLFGDLREHAAHHARGGGRLLADLAAAPATEVVSWDEWAPADPMKDPYECLLLQAPADLSIVCLDEDDPGALATFIHGLYKAKRKDRGNRIIFCSREEDKRLLADVVSRIPDRSPNRSPFYLGQRVHVLDTDLVGEIEYACVGKVPVQRKDPVPIGVWGAGGGPVTVSVRGYTVRAEECIVERADIAVASKYPGPPLENGIFVVTKATTQKDLLSVAKYCLLTLKLVFVPGTSLGTLAHTNDPEPTCLIDEIHEALSRKERAEEEAPPPRVASKRKRDS